MESLELDRTSRTRGHWSRLALARGLRMTYRQLDHACRTVPALELLTGVGSGGLALLTDAEAAEVRRMLVTVDRLLAVGLDDRGLLDAACRATLMAEPGTEITLTRSHRHGRWGVVVLEGHSASVRVVVG